MSTATTLAHHLDSLGTGDIDAILSDYGEESVVITPEGPVRGLEEIERLYHTILAKMLPPGSRFELLRQEIVGEVAYTEWRGESQYFILLMGTDTFIVRNGKIAYQTFSAHIQPKNVYRSARPPPP